MVAGGKRIGAGRKPGEKSKQVRIPESLVALVEELVQAHKGQADEYTEGYLIAMLGKEKFWSFDFSATLGAKNKKFFALRSLREKIETMDAREERIYEFLNGEI